MIKCETCKFGKMKTTLVDQEMVMERFCFHEIPYVQLGPGPRGTVIQITYRPKVDDDDFCSKWKEKDVPDAKQAASPSPTLIVDSN